MPVANWTSQTARVFSGTEATTVTVDTNGAANGLLTRDANNSISNNFTFIATPATSDDRSDGGGLIFSYTGTSAYYSAMRNTYSSGTLYLRKNGLGYNGGTAIASVAISRATYPANAPMRVTKNGTSIKIALRNTGGTFVDLISVTDASYSSGKLGYGYPMLWEAVTTWTFGSVTDNAAASGQSIYWT